MQNIYHVFAIYYPLKLRTKALVDSKAYKDLNDIKCYFQMNNFVNTLYNSGEGS